MSDSLTEVERNALTHWSMWGSDGYPVEHVGYLWFVRGHCGAGACPKRFMTKHEAVEQWEAYIRGLIDREAGR